MEESDRLQHQEERASDKKDLAIHDAAMDELFERAVVMAAEGLVKNAEVNEKLADNLGKLTSRVTSVEDVQHGNTRLLWVVIASLIVGLLVGGITVFGIFSYSIPNSKILVDCTTPSKPGHVHKCSDTSAQGGFTLSTAITVCEKNLPSPVHTLDVKQCLAQQLGLSLAPSPTP